MLQHVRECLQAHMGQLKKISAETGVAYDTLLKIKNGEGDPGFSKVETLRAYFASRARTSSRLQRETARSSV